MDNSLEKAMKKLKNGDQNALEKIYNSMYKGVYSFVMPILKDEQCVEDIIQQTFVQVYQKRESYKEDSSVRNWILTIAKNLAINEVNKRKKEIITDFNDSANFVPSEQPMQINTPLFDQARKILSDDEYQILTMHVIGEMKHREIADALQIPIGTVTWNYKRAIDKLKKELKKGE